MKSEITVITPELAKKMLEKNRSNRRLRKRKVNEYAADMIAGCWDMNGESICVDDEGNILDGQHRLNAVIKAGATIIAPICTVDKGQGKIYDVGAARRANDVMKLSKDDDLQEFSPNCTISSTSRQLLMFSGIAAPSVMEVITNIKENQECFRWMKDIGLSTVSSKGINFLPSQGKAAILAIYQNEESKETIERFVKLLREGIATEENDRVVMLLRNWLITTKMKLRGGGRSETSKAMYATIQTAYEKFKNGKGNIHHIQESKKVKYVWNHNIRKEK